MSLYCGQNKGVNTRKLMILLIKCHWLFYIYREVLQNKSWEWSKGYERSMVL